jgi:hypothetical protein
VVRVHPAVPIKSICYLNTTIPSGRYSNHIATTRQRASLVFSRAWQRTSFGTKGRMFKSCHSDQLIEHLANPEKYAPKKLPKKLGREAKRKQPVVNDARANGCANAAPSGLSPALHPALGELR